MNTAPKTNMKEENAERVCREDEEKQQKKKSSEAWWEAIAINENN